MIRPPCGACARIRANAARAHRNMPVTLTSMTCRQSASDISSIGACLPNMPALLNSASMRPNFAATASKARVYPRLIRHIAGQRQHPRVALRQIVQRRRTARDQADLPALGMKFQATAFPMPELAPVTMSVFAMLRTP